MVSGVEGCLSGSFEFSRESVNCGVFSGGKV